MKTVIYNEVTYWIGENAQDNWNIIDQSKQNYLWFHLDKLPSAHVILCSSYAELKQKYKNGELKSSPKNYINQAANYCKENSKYYTVIYTEIKNVSKGDTVGSVQIKGKPSKIYN